jgi:hypothetical protein
MGMGDDLGLATYSNSESTVLSCSSIFENLWVQSTSHYEMVNDHSRDVKS